MRGWLLGGVALLIFLAAPTGARADCEVSGVASVDRLRLRIEGHRLSTLAVENLPIAVRPGRGERYRDVRVLAPLAFGVRTDAHIPWTVPRPIAVADDMVWLTPEVEVETVRERQDREDLVIRAQVENGVWLRRLHVPCDAMSVGHGEGREDPPWRHSPGPRWRMLHGHVWVVARPDEENAPSVRLEATDGLTAPLVEIDRRGRWVRVMTRFASGAVLRGWVRQHHLRAGEPADADRHFIHSAPQVEAPLCQRREPRRGEYVGPAHITVGAQIRMRRDGTVWATVTEPAVFTVSVRENDPWARIVHVPGLRSDGRCPSVVRHSYVERSMVSLSGEGGRYDPMELLGLE